MAIDLAEKGITVGKLASEDLRSWEFHTATS
jgi:hypothetical protein